MHRALPFELRCGVNGSSAKDCTAEARDDEGNEVARPVHPAIFSACAVRAMCPAIETGGYGLGEGPRPLEWTTLSRSEVQALYPAR
jgi:hypothetical protein